MALTRVRDFGTRRYQPRSLPIDHLRAVSDQNLLEFTVSNASPTTDNRVPEHAATHHRAFLYSNVWSDSAIVQLDIRSNPDRIYEDHVVTDVWP